MTLHFLNRSRPRLVPRQTPQTLARAREAVGQLDEGNWTPGLTALAEAWYAAVASGERVSEDDAAEVLRGLVSRWWQPPGEAA